MWYLVMFFRYCGSIVIDKQVRVFRYFFCNRSYHCSCHMKGERCCECGVYYTEAIPDQTIQATTMSER